MATIRTPARTRPASVQPFDAALMKKNVIGNIEIVGKDIYLSGYETPCKRPVCQSRRTGLDPPMQ